MGFVFTYILFIHKYLVFIFTKKEACKKSHDNSGHVRTGSEGEEHCG